MSVLKLDIAHVSQHGNPILNDCGGAVLSMLTGKSLDEVIEVGRGLGVVMPLSFQEAYKMLAHYRLGSHKDYVRPLTILKIKAALAQRFPVIVLANYGMIPKEQRQSSFDGAHWFLAVGYDDQGVFVHDSNWSGERVGEGAYLYLENTLLDAMMKKPGGDNPKWVAQPYQGIVIKRPYPLLSDAAPPTPPPATDEATVMALMEELSRWKERAGQYELLYEREKGKVADLMTAVTEVVERLQAV